MTNCESYDQMLEQLILPTDIFEILAQPLKSLGLELRGKVSTDDLGKQFKYYQAQVNGKQKTIAFLHVTDMQDPSCASINQYLGNLFDKKATRLFVFSKVQYIYPAYTHLAETWKKRVGLEDVRFFASYEIGIIKKALEDARTNNQTLEDATSKIKEYMHLDDLIGSQVIPALPAPPQPQQTKIVRIFISYSHLDATYLEDNSLWGYLKGLESDEVEFWTDKEITVGDAWDDTIKAEISKAQIALILVSQPYLNSPYCQKTEIKEFLRKTEQEGLVIFPVMLSSCEWERFDWLKSRQFIPKGKKTIAKDYKDEGERAELFVEILTQLRTQIENVRQRTTSSG